MGEGRRSLSNGDLPLGRVGVGYRGVGYSQGLSRILPQLPVN